MTFAIKDRVKETSTTAGTGILNVDGVAGGFQSFAGAWGDGNTGYFCTADENDWEVALGTATAGTPDTLSRDTIIASSNGGAAVDWQSGGTRDVFAVVSADKTVYLDTDDIMTPLPKAFLGGLILSPGTDAAHDVDVTAGYCRGRDDDEDIKFAAAVGKQIDVTWATGGTPGTPTGGLSSSLSLTADTGYYVHAFNAAGVSEVGFDTSPTGANLITDHSATSVRAIGHVTTDSSSNIYDFVHFDDEFLRSGDGVGDVSDGAISNASFKDGTLSAPRNSIVHIEADWSNPAEPGARGRVHIKRKGSSQSYGVPPTVVAHFTGANPFQVGALVDIMVDGNSQIEYAGDETGDVTTINVKSVGFRMLERNNP